jgi:hypothetical protein
MNVNTIFPSNYLKAADLQGKQPRVTIERVELETLGQGKEAQQRPIIYFTGKDKGLVANKTNMSAIAAVFGDETDDWAGAEIILFETMVDYQGKVTPAIRVKIPPVAPAKRQVVTSGLPQEPKAVPFNTDVDDDSVPF